MLALRRRSRRPGRHLAGVRLVLLDAGQTPVLLDVPRGRRVRGTARRWSWGSGSVRGLRARDGRLLAADFARRPHLPGDCRRSGARQETERRDPQVRTAVATAMRPSAPRTGFHGTMTPSPEARSGAASCRVCTGAEPRDYFTADDNGSAGPHVAGATYRASAWVRAAPGSHRPHGEGRERRPQRLR